MNKDDRATDLPAGPTPNLTEDARGGFFDNILAPGSSLDPTFLLIVDGALGLLLLVLFGLLVLTRGNIHLVFLIIIECCLWASVKWFVRELQQTQEHDRASADASTRPKDTPSRNKSD
ncbi:hypothetical protein BC628DRAFT_1417106 [Trametes gibbosa]|nr:hypothetical protein BC628DRAFT_1417106 [Trametes gibbosa]